MMVTNTLCILGACLLGLSLAAKVDPGQPLILTPYIEKGQIDQAFNMSKVNLVAGDTSHSGYFTVNKTYDSNMFFWFFPNKDANAPLLLWLQGGPGASSLFALFVENGPYKLDKSLNISMRDIAWTNKYSMLYIDNPVGTGFSFTNSSAGYKTDQMGVADDLYSALSQFFQVFKTYAKNDFYVTGESYAGKYVPAITYKIHMANQNKANQPINLKGMAIGNGLSDPETMFPQYADYLFHIGLLDEKQRDYFQSQMGYAVEYIRNGYWLESFKIFDALLNGDKTNYPTWLFNQTGCDYYFNFLMCTAPEEFLYFPKYLSQPSVRAAIHVGNRSYSNESGVVEDHLLEDLPKSVKSWVASIMNAKYKVMFYTGALDIIVALPLTEAFLQSVQWYGQLDYMKADRTIWKINPKDSDVAGYVRQVDSFFQVVVKGGGHMIPYDQPARSFDMIDRFISGRNFGPKE